MVKILNYFKKTYSLQEDNDPWRDKNKKAGPPDLEALLKNLHRHLKKTMQGGNNTPPPGSSSNKPTYTYPRPGNIMLIAAGVVFGLYVIFGFFLVQPGEEAAVLRFGRYVRTVGPGLHWLPPIITSKEIVNTRVVHQLKFSAEMITKEVNIINLDLKVRYRIENLKDYLFNVKAPEESLTEATSSAMRQVIADATLEEVLTTRFKNGIFLGDTIKNRLIQNFTPYQTGIQIQGVEIGQISPPNEVKDAFNDAIKAQEDEHRYIKEAEGYTHKVLPVAEGRAARMLQEAGAYANQVVQEAKGRSEQFKAMLPEYKAHPEVTRERMYLFALQDIFSNTNMIVIDKGAANNLVYLPLDKIFGQPSPSQSSTSNTSIAKIADNNSSTTPATDAENNALGITSGLNAPDNFSLNQPQQRDEFTRNWRE